jgi:hypothetical protein
MKLQTLQQLHCPLAIVVEGQQATDMVVVQTSFWSNSCSEQKKCHARIPSSKSALFYQQAFDGYVCYNHVRIPKTTHEAEKLLEAEKIEMLNAYRACASEDESATCRSISLHLLLPIHWTRAHDDVVLAYIDTITKLAKQYDEHVAFELIHMMCFDVFANEMCVPALHELGSSCYDHRSSIQSAGLSRPIIALRWFQVLSCIKCIRHISTER